MTDELPEGWIECKTGDISQIVGGGTPDARKEENFSTESGIPWLTPADLSGYEGIYISRGKRFLTKRGFESSSAKLMPKGAVLFSSRAPIGYVAVAANEISTNQGFKSFVCSDAVLSEYLYFWLKYAKPLAEELAAGTTFAEISGTNAAKIPMLLPPLREQRRIAETLEALLAEVEQCKGRMAKIPVLLKRFRQSVLAAACSGRLTADWREQNQYTDAFEQNGAGQTPENVDLPPSWDWILSSDAFEFVTSGSRGWAQYYADSGAMFLRVGNLNHESIALDLRSIQHVCPPQNAEGVRTRVQRGDILISITADVGMVAFVDHEIGEAYINQHVALARPHGDINRRYLAYFLAAKNGGQQQFLNLQRGATKVGLGLEDIRRIWIARPPLTEQEEIVRRIEALLALADRIETGYDEGKRRIDGLTQSILAKAFRGELVPTEAELAAREGRDYESAAQLLERIRSLKTDAVSDATDGRHGRKRQKRRYLTKL